MHILWFSFIYRESSLQTERGLPKLTHDPSKNIDVETPKAHQPGKKKALKLILRKQISFKTTYQVVNISQNIKNLYKAVHSHHCVSQHGCQNQTDTELLAQRWHHFQNSALSESTKQHRESFTQKDSANIAQWKPETPLRAVHWKQALLNPSCQWVQRSFCMKIGATKSVRGDWKIWVAHSCYFTVFITLQHLWKVTIQFCLFSAEENYQRK